MKHFLSLFIIITLFFSCNNKNNPTLSTATLLTKNTWNLDRYTKPDGTPINDSELSTASKYLYVMNFQFLSNGVTRAIDKSSNATINSGTWKLEGDNKTIDIQVTGFTGNFTIISISNTGLVLQTETDNFISNVGEKVNLEFSAVVK